MSKIIDQRDAELFRGPVEQYSGEKGCRTFIKAENRVCMAEPTTVVEGRKYCADHIPGGRLDVKYVGVRNVDSDLFEVVVERAGQRPYHLNPRTDIVNHSPTGVCWGYGGSGPAQLALGLLIDFLSEGKAATTRGNIECAALELYQEFKWATVAKFAMDEGWEMTGQEVDAELVKINARRFAERKVL